MPPRKKKKNDKDDGKTDAQRAAVLETDEEILRERQVSTKIYQSALEQQNCLVRVAVHRGGYSNEEKPAVQIGRERYREESEHEKVETHGGISRTIRAD